MTPVIVTDDELRRGIDDVTKWLPNPGLGIEHWALPVASSFFYDTLTPSAKFTPRNENLDQVAAARHASAIAAGKHLSPQTKIEAIARLFTLWFKGVTYGV